MLEAAAVAMHLVESGALADRGTLGPLLREEPYRPVLGNPDQQVDRWRRAMDEFAAAIDAARADREAARRLMQVFTNASGQVRQMYDSRRYNRPTDRRYLRRHPAHHLPPPRPPASGRVAAPAKPPPSQLTASQVVQHNSGVGSGDRYVIRARTEVGGSRRRGSQCHPDQNRDQEDQ